MATDKYQKVTTTTTQTITAADGTKTTSSTVTSVYKALEALAVTDRNTEGTGTAESLSSLFLSHRSIRSYTDQEVPPELIRTAIEESIAGASSSGNLNSFSLIVTRDPESKKRLRELHEDQDMVTECSVVITVCADWFRVREWLKSQNAKDNFDNFFGYHVAVVDAVIVAQNLALALESRGLGICYLGTTLNNMETISEHLQLPDTVIPITTLTVGYPAENPSKRDRLPTKAYIHEEVYRKPDAEELSEVYASREKKGWERYNAHPELKKIIDENGIKNLAEFYTSDFKYPESMTLRDGRMIFDFLEKKNFTAMDSPKEE
ncbi:putative oxidoreductase [Rhizoclosmatium globosum]|uniref:Putative oxidoreductase n=1 Tax=Rhizoclosmatium globosum TaxID=329046 RepID=A0A1Y2BCB0_9FUNG|nr:putative oxidoreductase [Rhizoclosmatium globosum]|eukprot:ORY32471.1 putative oxidoreductase [Rhizoclosmatium globosum]